MSVTKAFVLSTLAVLVAAHGSSEEASDAPVDAVLWIHIFIQASVWGVLFPTGMVLGITRSRWHVPLQVSVLLPVVRQMGDRLLMPEFRVRNDDCRLFPGSLAQGKVIPAVRA